MRAWREEERGGLETTFEENDATTSSSKISSKPNKYEVRIGVWRVCASSEKQTRATRIGAWREKKGRWHSVRKEDGAEGKERNQTKTRRKRRRVIAFCCV